MLKPSELLPDDQLVAACVASGCQAWKGLIQRYGKWLERVVSSLLQRRGINDGNAVEEVMANVWLVLWMGRKLAKYQSERGPFRRFLWGVAKKEVLLWVRQQRALARRRQLLILSGKQEVAIDGEEGFGLTIDDYLSLLPDQARVYVYQEWLQIPLPGGRRSFSAANYRQLLCRALKEFPPILGNWPRVNFLAKIKRGCHLGFRGFSGI